MRFLCALNPKQCFSQKIAWELQGWVEAVLAFIFSYNITFSALSCNQRGRDANSEQKLQEQLHTKAGWAKRIGNYYEKQLVPKLS